MLTSQLAAGARARAEAAQRRAKESETLYELGQALMAQLDLPHVLEAVTHRVVDVLDVNSCTIFTPAGSGQLRLAAEMKRSGQQDRESYAAAAWVYQHGAQVGLPMSGFPDQNRHRVYVPLRTADRIVGVMEVGPKRSGEALDTEEHRLVTSFAAQTALVIVRAQGDEERRRRVLLEESNRLKSALLAAVSHDLRSPLASIKTAATTLLLPDGGLAAADRREMLAAIDQEADRLNRLVGNLLDLSRIEAGVLRPVLDWYEMRDVLDTLVPRIRPLLGARPFTTDLPPKTPALHIDLLRIEQALFNLFENAAKYAGPNTPVELCVRHDDRGLSLALVDHGPGVPARQRDQIFLGFHRGQEHSDRNPGTGLGLAICRGIAEAHGGSVSVQETPGGGATFVFTLPTTHLDCEALR
jgi:two-component system sensor histidine kinase KdpD